MSSERPLPIWDAADVTTWHERMDARDLELAEQLLQAPEQVRESILEWLASAEAVRARNFVRQLGRADDQRLLRERFEAEARGNPDTALLPAYVAGWGEIDPDSADAWLRDHLDDFTQVVIAIMSTKDPTARRFELLERVVERGDVDTAWMRVFADRQWIGAVEAARALTLLKRVRARGLSPTAGLDMTLQVFDDLADPDARAQALELLDDFLAQTEHQRVPMIAQRGWQRAALTLAEAGRYERVAEHTLALLGSWSGNLALAQHVLRDLAAAGHGPALWRHLRDALVVHLLRRFGSAGDVAKQLHARAVSSPQGGASLEFERRQLANAEAWSGAAESPEARAWADAVARRLRERIDALELRERSRRRYA